MLKRFVPKDYQTLFRLDVNKGRVTGLFGDLIIRGSLSLGNPIITFDGWWWTFRLHKKSEAILAKEGLSVFKNEDRFTKYAEKFRQYIKSTNKNIVEKYKHVSDNITKDEFHKTAKELQKFWYYYGITEAVYHDLAYEIAMETKDKIIKKNLADLEKLKFEGRALLNSFILENGTIDNILRSVSRKHLNKKREREVIIKYFFLHDLKNLLSGEKIDLDIIKKRKKAFVIVHINNKIQYIEGKEARVITSSFKKSEQAEYKKAIHGLVGQTANRGKIQGKVVISPMLDIKAAMEVEREMKKGDILIVQSTNPDLMVLCDKAGAIVTDQGGMLSHAAVISRELRIPCIVGTTNGTKVFKTGDLVEVDANKGIVKIIKNNP